MIQKCFKKLPRSLPNPLQDDQDEPKMTSWTPTWTPKGSKWSPQTFKKVLCLVFFRIWVGLDTARHLPGTPKTPQDLPRHPIDLDFDHFFINFSLMFHLFSNDFSSESFSHYRKTYISFRAIENPIIRGRRQRRQPLNIYINIK